MWLLTTDVFLCRSNCTTGCVFLLGLQICEIAQKLLQQHKRQQRLYQRGRTLKWHKLLAFRFPLCCTQARTHTHTQRAVGVHREPANSFRLQISGEIGAVVSLEGLAAARVKQIKRSLCFVLVSVQRVSVCVCVGWNLSKMGTTALDAVLKHWIKERLISADLVSAFLFLCTSKQVSTCLTCVCVVSVCVCVWGLMAVRSVGPSVLWVVSFILFLQLSEEQRNCPSRP